MARVERIRERIDEDGVVSRTSEVIDVRPLPEEPAYIKLYVEDIGRITGLRPVHSEVLLYVAASVGYDGFVVLNARRIAAIALTIGCTSGTVKNALTELCSVNVIRRAGRGEYELDPRLFARGAWKDIRERRKAFVAAIRYLPSGQRTIDTVEATGDARDRAELEARGQQRLTD